MSRRPRVRKPKFRVGQIARIRQGWMHENDIIEIFSVRKGKDAFEYYALPRGECVVEFALRPLTKREIGLRSNPKPVPQGRK